MNQNKLLNLLGCFVLNIFLISTVQGQSMYTDYQVLTNDTLTSSPIDGVSEAIVYHPQNGAVRLKKIDTGSFNFEYQPREDFIGQDTFTLEFRNDFRGDLKYIHAIVTVRESFVYASDDFFVLDKDNDFVYVDIFSNDHTTLDGELFLGGFPFKQNVYVDVNDSFDSLYLKPRAAYSGTAKLIYKVCDELDNCADATVHILIIDPEMSTISDSLFLQTVSNRSINFYMTDTDYNIINSPSLGTIEEDYQGHLQTYIPYQNIDGRDTVIYSNGEVERTVYIEIVKEKRLNSFVVDDYYYAYPGDSIEFDVFENDLVKNGVLRTYTDPVDGNITRIKDGKFKYFAPSKSGLYNFSYQACIGNNNCELGNVSIYVGTLAPEGLYRYNLTTLKNRPFVINYDIPLSNFNFDISQAPQHGSLQVHPGFDTLNIGCEAVMGYNLVTYTPDPGFVGVDLFELQFCAQNDACQTVKVEMVVVDKELDPESCVCVTNCVWPGDMNADGKVDMLDLLTFGWHLGERGDLRPFADKHGWHAQYSPNWSKKSIMGSNLKHLDSDGNGLIEQNDLAAIEEFFNKRNDLAPQSRPSIKDFPMNLVHKGDHSPEIGEYVEFDIVVGTEQFQAAYLYGLSLRYDVDPKTVDTSSLELRFNSTSFLSYDASYVDLSIREGRTMNAGISRLDRFAPSGYGVIGTLGFVIEDELDGILTDKKLPVRIQFTDAHIVDGTGKVFALTDQEYVLEVAQESPANKRQKLSVFPNPVQTGQQLNARFNPVKSDAEISIYAMDGRVIHKGQVSQGDYQYNYLTDLADGVYIMVIRENEMVASQKFIIAR